MVQLAANIWADGPISYPIEPYKPDIRDWGTWIEQIINAFTSNGGLLYTSRAALFADLAHGVSAMAWVFGDATSSFNGIYVKSGASGSGSWTRVGDLPYSFIIASDVGAGTPNAIKATSSIPISGSALIWLTLANTNTDHPVTVSFNNGSPLAIKTNAGNDPDVGGLSAGMTVIGIVSGSSFRLISDQASAAIQAACESARDLAQSYANAAAAVMTTVLDPQFGNVAAAQLYNPTVAPTYIRTAGYTLSGDGGGALYKKVTSQPSHAGKIQIASGQWYELTDDVPTLEMFGAKGDGITNDTTARDNAATYIGYNGIIRLIDGKKYLVSNFNNPYGLEFIGRGEVITAVTGGFWQHNSYADRKHLHTGHEYLKRAYDYIRNSQGSTSGTLDVHVFGDSTVALDISGTGERPDVCFAQAMQDIGIPNINVTNQGVSGSKWGDDVFPSGKSTDYITATSSLFIFKYGINDAGYGLDTLIANMDSTLSAIRANANGGLSTLAILLMMPNSTSDSPNGRDERWYEQVSGIYDAMARKYHCAKFDTYALFQDSRVAANLWMDDSFGDGRAIHPTGMMNRWIYGHVVNEFFAGCVAGARTNHFYNEGDVSTVIAANTAPNTFRFGIFHNRAKSGNGWPGDGFVITEKNVDSGVIQTFYTYAPGVTRSLRRTANISGNSWNRWTGVPEAITLSNGWVNQGSPWKAPFATLGADGIVTLEGLIAGGTVTTGTIMGTLPVGMRPTADLVFIVATNGGSTKLTVNSAGQVVAGPVTTADGTWTSLAGISFLAA